MLLGASGRKCEIGVLSAALQHGTGSSTVRRDGNAAGRSSGPWLSSERAGSTSCGGSSADGLRANDVRTRRWFYLAASESFSQIDSAARFRRLAEPRSQRSDHRGDGDDGPPRRAFTPLRRAHRYVDVDRMGRLGGLDAGASKGEERWPRLSTRPYTPEATHSAATAEFRRRRGAGSCRSERRRPDEGVHEYPRNG